MHGMVHVPITVFVVHKRILITPLCEHVYSIVNFIMVQHVQHFCTTNCICNNLPFQILLICRNLDTGTIVAMTCPDFIPLIVCCLSHQVCLEHILPWTSSVS